MPESPRKDSDDEAGDADSVASTVESEEGTRYGFRVYRAPRRLMHHRLARQFFRLHHAPHARAYFLSWVAAHRARRARALAGLGPEPDYEVDDSEDAPMRALFTRRLGASPVASGGGFGDLFNKAKHPYEKELDKFLADLGRLDTSLSMQANIERFKSRLTSPECIAVLNHTTFAEYILSQAVQTIDGKPYHVGVELTSALRTMRTKLEQMSAKEFDGSNLGFTISHLPKMPHLQLEKPALAQIFDDRKGILLDLGGYAQVELLYDPNSDDPPSWPPQWKIGKGFNLPEGTEAAVHKVFKEFLEQPCAQMFIMICWLPNEQHDFLPEQFKKGNHFYGTTVSLESWLLADAYVSRSLFKFCDMITAACPATSSRIRIQCFIPTRACGASKNVC